jgi:hypothetical protein
MELKMWNGASCTPVGTCRKILRNPRTGKSYNIEFVICEGNFTPLLSHRVSEKLGLYKLNENNFERVFVIDKNVKSDSAENIIISQYPDVFDTSIVGSLPGVHSLKIDPNARPVVMPSHRVPVSLQEPLERELKRLVDLGVLAPVDGPTPWVSQLVVVRKPNSDDVRICLDPRELNRALQREHYRSPVIEDVLHQVADSKCFLYG